MNIPGQHIYAGIILLDDTHPKHLYFSFSARLFKDYPLHLHHKY